MTICNFTGAESSDHQQSPDLAHELERWLNERIDFSDLTAVLRTRAQIIYKYMVITWSFWARANTCEHKEIFLKRFYDKWI